MYQIIKNVISRGGYDLKGVLEKIDTLWAQQRFTDEQHTELVALARHGATAEKSVDLVLKIAELEARIRTLEGKTPAEDYQQYTEGKWYYAGDTCSFEGANYICIAPEGTVCVWSPAQYPLYWRRK